MLNWTSRWFVPGGILDADDVAYGMADTILAGVLVKGGRERSDPPENINASVDDWNGRA
jgi:hypothetical protein